MTEPVAVRIELCADGATVVLGSWAPGPLVALIKEAGGRWHRRSKRWRLRGPAGPLARQLERAGAVVTVTTARAPLRLPPRPRAVLKAADAAVIAAVLDTWDGGGQASLHPPAPLHPPVHPPACPPGRQASLGPHDPLQGPWDD